MFNKTIHSNNNIISEEYIFKFTLRFSEYNYNDRKYVESGVTREK